MKRRLLLHVLVFSQSQAGQSVGRVDLAEASSSSATIRAGEDCKDEVKQPNCDQQIQSSPSPWIRRISWILCAEFPCCTVIIKRHESTPGCTQCASQDIDGHEPARLKAADAALEVCIGGRLVNVEHHCPGGRCIADREGLVQLRCAVYQQGKSRKTQARGHRAKRELDEGEDSGNTWAHGPIVKLCFNVMTGELRRTRLQGFVARKLR